VVDINVAEDCFDRCSVPHILWTDLFSVSGRVAPVLNYSQPDCAMCDLAKNQPMIICIAAHNTSKLHKVIPARGLTKSHTRTPRTWLVFWNEPCAWWNSVRRVLNRTIVCLHTWQKRAPRVRCHPFQIPRH